MGGKCPIWVSSASKYLNSYFQKILEKVKEVSEYGENCWKCCLLLKNLKKKYSGWLMVSKEKRSSSRKRNICLWEEKGIYVYRSERIMGISVYFSKSGNFWRRYIFSKTLHSEEMKYILKRIIDYINLIVWKWWFWVMANQCQKNNCWEKTYQWEMFLFIG